MLNYYEAHPELLTYLNATYVSLAATNISKAEENNPVSDKMNSFRI